MLKLSDIVPRTPSRKGTVMAEPSNDDLYEFVNDTMKLRLDAMSLGVILESDDLIEAVEKSDDFRISRELSRLLEEHELALVDHIANVLNVATTPEQRAETIRVLGERQTRITEIRAVSLLAVSICRMINAFGRKYRGLSMSTLMRQRWDCLDERIWPRKG